MDNNPTRVRATQELFYEMLNDITTDCGYSEMVVALKGINTISKPQTGIFRSEYVFQLPEYNIEILGSFGINTSAGVCHIPMNISAWWDEIPLASPEAWFIAYRLMGRDEKADWLREFLEENGVSRYIASVMLAEPLPNHLRKEASELFGM